MTSRDTSEFIKMTNMDFTELLRYIDKKSKDKELIDKVELLYGTVQDLIKSITDEW